jgi:hypothetical protein
MAKIWIEQSIVEKLMEIVDNEFSASAGRRPGYDEVETYWAAKDAIDAAKAQSAATTAQGPIRWQDYPWQCAGFKPRKKCRRWFAVSPIGVLREYEHEPTVHDEHDGWAFTGTAWMHGVVDLNGTDWRATLREIVP